MIEAIEVTGINLLPGSRHGVECPTALVRLRWQGERPNPEALQRLEDRLSHALWFLERLDLKYMSDRRWRSFASELPLRRFPEDFLLEPAPDRLAGLLAAGLTALQWGAQVPVTSAVVLADDGEEIALAVPYWLPPKLEAALTVIDQIVRELSAAPATESQDPGPEAEPSPGLQALEGLLEGGLGKDALDVDGFHMAWEAQQRGLPLARVDFGVVEIGHGASGRRFLGSLHGVDAVASVQASNKLVIKRQLLRARVPVPPYQLVVNEEQALAAAQLLGWPVVLKPIDQSLGKGVTANIWRPVDLLRAYRQAREFSVKPLLLERHCKGDDHRIVVIDGEVVAALTYRYVEVRGDGFQSLGQLIERARGLCADPEAAALYGQDRESRRLIDDQGLSLDDVVESGRVVRLRSRLNPPPHTGRMVDVLETLHPELAQLAVRSAAALGVRLAGLDVITTEASRPPLETGAVVLELNPRPLLRMIRRSPAPREIDRQVFEIGCPAGYGSIPVLLLDGSALAGRLLAALEAALLGTAQVVGSWRDPLAADPSMAQVRIAGEPVVWVEGEGSLEAPGQLLLSDGRVEVALLNLAPESWQSAGFPCSRCSAGVLTDADGLLERGLLTEWLSVVAGPVVVVDGHAALLEAVGAQVGDRLVGVSGEAAALAVLLTQVAQQDAAGRRVAGV